METEYFSGSIRLFRLRGGTHATSKPPRHSAVRGEFAKSSLTSAQTIYPRDDVDRQFGIASCQEGGLIIPPSGSKLVSPSPGWHTARDRADSSISGHVQDRPPSSRYQASSRDSLSLLLHSVNAEFSMECEGYECHVQVLAVRRPCLRTGKFWSSRSGLLR